MSPEVFDHLAQLGGTVVTAAMFLWYLVRRDAAIEQALRELSAAIHSFKPEEPQK